MVNFINNLHAVSHTKVLLYFCQIQNLAREKLRKALSYQKCVRKMLLKLTPCRARVCLSMQKVCQIMYVLLEGTKPASNFTFLAWWYFFNDQPIFYLDSFNFLFWIKFLKGEHMTHLVGTCKFLSKSWTENIKIKQ